MKILVQVGETMTHESRFNALQGAGLIISVLGLLFIAFPSLIGLFAVKFVTLIFIIIGFYSMTFAIFVKSKISMLISIVMILLGYFAFTNPGSVLFFIGLTCLISGLNGIFLTFSRFRSSSERTLISSILLLLLGVFAVINSKAALSTVVLIVGIIIVVLGVILFFIGSTMPKRGSKTFFYTFGSMNAQPTPPKPQNQESKRVVISIDDDEVEEIDFKEL